MDIEELQKRWKSLDIETQALRDENVRLRRKLCDTNIRGLNMRLYRRMLYGAITCAIAPAMLIPCVHVMHFGEATIYAYILFFLIICGCYGYLAWRVSDMSYLSQPVLQATCEIGRREIMMRRFRVFGRLLAIPVLILLFSDIYQDEMTNGGGGLIGGLIGGVIGLIIGLRIERSNRRIMRQIKSTIEEIESSAD